MKRNYFASALAAATLSIGLSGLGNATTIYFLNQDVPIPSDPAGVYVDLSTGATGTAPFAGADANLFFGGFVVGNDADLPAVPSPSWQPVRLGTDNFATIANLPFGTWVDAASPMGADFGGSFDHVGTEFTEGVSGYIGFSLDEGGGPLFGWMRVTLEFAGGGTIHEWAYEDTETHIPVGLPEPTTGVLALLGLSTLALRRRRR